MIRSPAYIQVRRELGTSAEVELPLRSSPQLASEPQALFPDSKAGGRARNQDVTACGLLRCTTPRSKHLSRDNRKLELQNRSDRRDSGRRLVAGSREVLFARAVVQTVVGTLQRLRRNPRTSKIELSALETDPLD